MKDSDELWAVYNRAGGRLTAELDEDPAPSRRRQRMTWRCALSVSTTHAWSIALFEHCLVLTHRRQWAHCRAG